MKLCQITTNHKTNISGYGAKPNSFSSPEPLGLICNRPRDRKTTGFGDENEPNSTLDTSAAQALKWPT